MAEIKLEVWTSDHSRTERHYFIEGGDRGYQHNTYLFGYNPDVIPPHVAECILTLVTQNLK